uniref:Uncharacterized protein n=1 Tax=Panagrellus redivivus TaxID=6233 RepID=A0A7E4UZM2_PANRE
MFTTIHKVVFIFLVAVVIAASAGFSSSVSVEDLYKHGRIGGFNGGYGGGYPYPYPQQVQPWPAFGKK